MLEREEVLKIVRYDSITGLFYRSSRTANCISIGDIAGTSKSSTSKARYSKIKINGNGYPAHKVAWLIVYGIWPDVIDHINGDTFDNRIENLRSVTITENNKNKAKGRNNRTGIMGVSYSSSSMKWKSQINSNGVRYHLGYFSDFFEACCARKSAERDFEFHLNHGRSVNA